MTSASSQFHNAIETRLTATIESIIGPEAAPALTGALYPDGFPIVIITARRDGLVSSQILDIEIAAELSDEELEEQVRWMIEHAMLELDGGEDGLGSS